MIDGRGYLKIIDFGLGKYIPFLGPNNERCLKSFTMCGTTEYLSPESVTGKVRLSHRSWELRRATPRLGVDSRLYVCVVCVACVVRSITRATIAR